MSDIEPVRDDPDCALPVALPVDPVEPPVEPVALPPAVDPVLPVELLPVEPEPLRFWSVPFTSTRLPTSVEKFEALPVSRYVVPPDADELVDPAVLPVGEPAVEPVVPVADPVDPVDDEDPLDIDASVRM